MFTPDALKAAQKRGVLESGKSYRNVNIQVSSWENDWEGIDRNMYMGVSRLKIVKHLSCLGNLEHA